MANNKTFLEKLVLREFLSPKSRRALLREAGEDNGLGGGADAMGGADPNAGDAEPMGGANEQGVGGGADAMVGGADPNAGGAEPMGGADGQGLGGADPTMVGADAMGGGMPPMGGDEDEEDDDSDTIDIDDLTNAQQKMNDKINDIGKGLGNTDDKIVQLMQSVNALMKTIDSQNAEIASLQQDIVKRNPTPTEKLRIQSLNSYPYNTGLDAYWQNKIDNGMDNYDIEVGGLNSKADGGQVIDGRNADNEVEYEITQDDVDDATDEDVYNSFDINSDDEENHNYFNARM